jgi:hypothetical protein
MISRDLRFGEFLQAMQGHNFADVLASAIDESAEAQGQHRNVRNRRMVNSPALNYCRKLSGLVFFLRSGVRPGGLSNEEFQLLRPLCEEWIAKGQMLDGVLQLFQR